MAQIGIITPPIGMNVFAISGVAQGVPLETIFKGIIPFWIYVYMAFSGMYNSPCWNAGKTICITVGKVDAFLGKCIKIGCLNLLIVTTAVKVIPSPDIADEVKK